MTEADCLSDYIASPSNRKLLRNFAIEKLQLEWPHMKTAVVHAVDLHFDEVKASIRQYYKTWAITPENIADVNIHIWTTIKPKVVSTLKGAKLDPEEALDSFFIERRQHLEESKTEHVIQERSLDAMHEKYLASWK